ncbi:oxidoreductase [Opitutaceae bacterium EW11]|nr:oxidoreductase [Opitutaceae bacterium EW11]
MQIGIVGTDTSHAVAFAEHFHQIGGRSRRTAFRISVGYAGGSAEIPISATRVNGFRKTLEERFGVAFVGSPEEVAARCDALLVLSVDGNTHLPLVRMLAPFGRPLFVDKPFALSSADAREILAVARRHGAPIMSCSSLRFAPALTALLESGRPNGADFYGPLSVQPGIPTLFWYGIHACEMLVTALGPDFSTVSHVAQGEDEVYAAVWEGGAVGTLRLNVRGRAAFGGTLHYPNRSAFCDAGAGYFGSMVEAVIQFFRTGVPPVASADTAAVIRFLEEASAAREAHLSNSSVTLS